MLKELLALPCSFSARQRYCPSPCGVISTISSTDSSSAVMVPTSSPSFSQVRVGAGLPWVLQCSANVVPSWTVIDSFTTGSRGGSATQFLCCFIILHMCTVLGVQMSSNSRNTTEIKGWNLKKMLPWALNSFCRISKYLNSYFLLLNGIMGIIWALRINLLHDGNCLVLFS